jgi:hypothetical protein
VANCDDLIATCLNGGWISPFDGDRPQANSDDSYNHFIARHKVTLHTYAELAHIGHYDYAERAAAEQAEWEHRMAKRQRQREEQSTLLWQANEASRITKSASSIAKSIAEWRAKRQARAEADAKCRAKAEAEAERQAQKDDMTLQSAHTEGYRAALHYWADRSPSYAAEPFMRVMIHTSCTTPDSDGRDAEFQGGRYYIVPRSIAHALVRASQAVQG